MGKNFSGGKELAVVIACLTTHYPLEPMPQHTHTLSSSSSSPSLRPCFCMPDCCVGRMGQTCPWCPHPLSDCCRCRWVVILVVIACPSPVETCGLWRRRGTWWWSRCHLYSIVSRCGRTTGRASKEKGFCHCSLCWPHRWHFFFRKQPKLTKIKNHRSSRHVESDSTWLEDCQIERSPSKLVAKCLKVWWDWQSCYPSCWKIDSSLMLVCPFFCQILSIEKSIPAWIKNIGMNAWQTSY